jgi:hypothetical protein
MQNRPEFDEMPFQITQIERERAYFYVIRAVGYRFLNPFKPPVLRKELVASQVRQAPSGAVSVS